MDGHPVERISAVTLVTGDMAAAAGFYQALGFLLLSGGPHEPFTTFEVGGSYVNLQLVEDDRPPSTVIWGRVIFWVDDVDVMHRRAIDAGYEPLTVPVDAAWGERFFHIRDPDGHELSFARPLTTDAT
ncbi:MAG: VOC family protein [Acidimicrobiales bacterium]